MKSVSTEATSVWGSNEILCTIQYIIIICWYTFSSSHSRAVNQYLCLGLFVPFGEFFIHMETSPLKVKGCKFGPIFGTKLPLNSEDFLASGLPHLYCAMEHPFRWSFLRNCWRVFSSGVVTTCFNDYGLSRPGFQHRTFRLRGERWCSQIERLLCKNNPGCSNPGRDMPKSLKQVVTTPRLNTWQQVWVSWVLGGDHINGCPVSQ